MPACVPMTQRATDADDEGRRTGRAVIAFRPKPSSRLLCEQLETCMHSEKTPRTAQNQSCECRLAVLAPPLNFTVDPVSQSLFHRLYFNSFTCLPPALKRLQQPCTRMCGESSSRKSRNPPRRSLHQRPFFMLQTPQNRRCLSRDPQTQVGTCRCL
ncbi:hypothetical protein TGRH88_054570 [Toxoplasma gondii]|uniref:Uncharacterized protein n=1 Tax=Toxoplasma gondii TaxID=5811 RepID=A0A7J6JWV8_TOXGO|nr:hypothetical protein TGRH88_054570 [Toxoplasma gondii]